MLSLGLEGSPSFDPSVRKSNQGIIPAMLDENLEAPSSSAQVEIQSNLKPKPRIWWILGGIGIILLLGLLGGFLGYQGGIESRLSFQATQEYGLAAEQFNLALEDMAAGRFEIARQRLEAVIQIEPGYPGVVEKLSVVILALQPTPTPTLTPKPTLTPTPDNRGREEIFNQAKQHLANEEWQMALDTLDALRKEDISYRAIEVDSMYYVALRNRGVERIAEGSLEMGLYLLSLAERFGYLDSQALGMRTWTRFYLTGASFWKVDWAQASYYFGMVYPYYPGLRDSSGITAKDRYREATLRYADQLALAEDYCTALEQYNAVWALGLDPTIEPTVTAVREACEGPQVTPEPPPTDATITPTISLTPGETPTEIPLSTNTPPAPGG